MSLCLTRMLEKHIQRALQRKNGGKSDIVRDFHNHIYLAILPGTFLLLNHYVLIMFIVVGAYPVGVGFNFILHNDNVVPKAMKNI